MANNVGFWQRMETLTIKQVAILAVGGIPTDKEFIKSESGVISVIEEKLRKHVKPEFKEFKRLCETGHSDDALDYFCSEFGMFFYKSFLEVRLSKLKENIELIELNVTEVKHWFRTINMKPEFFFPEDYDEKLTATDQPTHQTNLMKIMNKTINRYYGENFDFENKDSYPRQEDVVEWLEQAHKLSRRRAEAIDIIIRPSD